LTRQHGYGLVCSPKGPENEARKWLRLALEDNRNDT